MKHSILGLALLVTVAGGAVHAQSQGQPAEFPPESYTGNQYVDSTGCAFIRAGISGITNWVPRMNRQREQLCGFQPSLAQAPVVEAVPEVAAVAAPASPVTVEVPAVVEAPVAVAAPQVVATPAPVATRSALTFAEACAGLTGVQPGMINSATGEPIDCGTGSTEPRRVTLAEICAEVAASGQSFVNQATGQPVNCGAAVASAASVASPDTPSGYAQTWADGRINTQRGLPEVPAVQTQGTGTTVSTMSAPVLAATD